MRITSGAILGASLLLYAMAAARAQQTQPSPPSAPLKPLVPLAASSLADTPDAYIGENVSVVGVVEIAHSPTAFSIDQDGTRSTGKDVLVLVPRLTAPLGLNTYVTILGEVVRFDPVETAKRIAVDLPPEAIAKYRDRPAILARAVLDAAMVDLVREPPPPLSPEEAAYDALMKRIGPAFSALREALGGSDAYAAREQVSVLQQAFSDTAAFWKSRGAGDAVGWATDGRTHLDAIESAVARGDWEAVKTSAGELGRTCQSCHGQYRDRLDDGTYRIKGVNR